MHVFRADNMNDIMRYVVRAILRYGEKVTPRGAATLELPEPAVIELTNINNNVVTECGDLNTHTGYAKAELKFYLKGTNKYRDIGEEWAWIWAPFSDDGETVNSAYGYQIFGNHPDTHGIDQFEWVYETLKKDPDSRRAVININLPIHKTSKKDMPCTVFLQYMIRNGKLHAYTFMRSNDIYRGFRYDIWVFTELQRMLASKLNVEPGVYYHIVTSLHSYVDDLDSIKSSCGVI